MGLTPREWKEGDDEVGSVQCHAHWSRRLTKEGCSGGAWTPRLSAGRGRPPPERAREEP
jgi:hypothetical protein